MAEKKHTFVICAYKESPYLEACIRDNLNENAGRAMVLLDGGAGIPDNRGNQNRRRRTA